MVSVFDVCRQVFDDGLKDRVKIGGDVFCGTSAGRDDGSSRGTVFVDFGK